jgi:hypothetical protein
MPKIFQYDMEVITSPGNDPTGETISGNLQPTTYAPARMTYDHFPAEYYGTTMYVLYTDNLGTLIPPKGPWQAHRLRREGMYYKIVVIREFANHFQVLLDETRN